MAKILLISGFLFFLSIPLWAQGDYIKLRAPNTSTSLFGGDKEEENMIRKQIDSVANNRVYFSDGSSLSTYVVRSFKWNVDPGQPEYEGYAHLMYRKYMWKANKSRNALWVGLGTMILGYSIHHFSPGTPYKLLSTGQAVGIVIFGAGSLVGSVGGISLLIYSGKAQQWRTYNRR